jgi:hypothetical protein
LLRAVGVENPHGDKAALWREKARGKRFLIVVDDVHDPAQVTDLHTPGSAMILTSVRRWNELPSVTWVKIAGLTEAAANQFFRKVLDPARVDAEIDVTDEVLARISYLPNPIRVLGGKLTGRPNWTVAMLLAQMKRETRLGDAIPSDCTAVLAPMIKAEEQLTEQERHLLQCFAGRDADVIDVCAAAEMSGTDPGVIEYVLEALADVHLIEPLVLGQYRLPRFVRMYFGWRTPMLTS